MDKAKIDGVKAKLAFVRDAVLPKMQSAISEVKTNFRADEGATGFPKVKSMFVNLWKSGTTGKGTLIVCSSVLLLLLIVVFCGNGKSGGDANVAVANNVSTGDATAAAIKVQKGAVAVASRAQETAKVTDPSVQTEPVVKNEPVDKDEPVDEDASTVKKEIVVKDVKSAKEAVQAAMASGDWEAVTKAQEVLKRMEELEAKKEEELAAKEQAELEAKEKAEEEAQLAKAKAEREAKEAAKRAAFEAIPDKLVVKGLYAGMPGDSALEACKQLVAKEGDLVVVDYRKGIDREKDEETKAKEKKEWDARVKLAETDIDLFLKWNSLNGKVYNPAVEACEGAFPDPRGFADAVAKARASLPGAVVDPGEGLFRDKPHRPRLKWMSGDKSAQVPGPQWTLASAMAAFAAVYGYQVEWMLPGRHSGAENAKDSKPQLVPIETLKSADFVVLRGVNGILGSAGRNGEFRSIFSTQLYSKVYDKGLRIHRKCDGRLVFRLVPQDSTGKPIEKSDLATEIACNFPDMFKKGMSNSEMVKDAEKYVDAVSEWVDVLSERARSSAAAGNSRSSAAAGNSSSTQKASRKRESKKPGASLWKNVSGADVSQEASSLKRESDKASRVIEDLFRKNIYESVMEKLANNCNASVEFAVLAEPCEKFEQVTEVFTIPASDYEAASKFVDTMDRNLGKWSENAVGSDGSRKRVFFKHGIEDIRSPLWFRLVLKTTNGVEVARDDAVKNWLTARGHYKPSERVKVPPKNLIQVSINQKGVPDNKLKGLCFVWTDEADNVKETYYNAEGMNRFFDAKDLSGEEFANLLVKSYPGLPCLNMKVEEKNPGRGVIKEFVWTYSCPKGYHVKLFERSYFNDDGVKYDANMLERDPAVSVALSLVDMLPDKYLSISATKSAPARKFD